MPADPDTSAAPGDGAETPTRPERGGGARLAPDELRKALDRLATEIVLFIGARGQVLSSNRLVNLGWDEDERIGTHIAEHLHPDDILGVFDLIERARASAGFREQIQVRVRHRDGSWRTFDCTVLDARVADPTLTGAVIVAREALAAPTPGPSVPSGADDDSTRFLSLAEAVPLGILSADARGWVVFANDAASRLFDLRPENLNGEGWIRAVLADDRSDVEAAARAVVKRSVPQEVSFRLATGLFQRWAHARFVPLGDGARRTGWIATVEDVTERRRAESQLAHLATHDTLTKLPNRALLEDRLRQASHRLRRDGSTLSVLFLDLDGFKSVNDTHGHATGDRVLVEVARRLRYVVREVDTVARLGGDEFVVVCEGIGADEAAEVATRIEQALAVPMIVEGATVRVGTSVGHVTATEHDGDVADLLNRADQAMYRVKQTHRAEH